MSSFEDLSDEMTMSRRRRSIFQPAQESTKAKTVDPLLDQLDFRDLSAVIEAELGCLERLGIKMTQVPEDICVFENKVSSGGNSVCWTGTTLGR